MLDRGIGLTLLTLLLLCGQVKQASKEREVAVAMLAQFKSSGAQQEGHARMQEQLLQAEVHELQKRCVKCVLYILLALLSRTD